MAPAPGEEASLAMATVVQVYAQTVVASRCGGAVRGAASGITRAAVFAQAGMALSFQGQLYAGARRAHRGDARKGGCRRSSGPSAGGSEGTKVYAQPRGWILPGGRSTEWGGAKAGDVPGAFRRLDGLRGGELPANMAVCSGGRRWPCLAGDGDFVSARSPRGQAPFSPPTRECGMAAREVYADAHGSTPGPGSPGRLLRRGEEFRVMGRRGESQVYAQPSPRKQRRLG
jgi:hypothetical protein